MVEIGGSKWLVGCLIVMVCLLWLRFGSCGVVVEISPGLVAAVAASGVGTVRALLWCGRRWAADSREGGWVGG